MKRRCLVPLLSAVLLVSGAQLSSAQESLLRPASSDFFFQEQKDGSILAADTEGTYYFADFSTYVQSPFFQQHGLRCGFDRLAHPIAFASPSDCNSTHTTPAAEYEPAAGPDYVIPVVFHILRTSGGTGNVSDALINSQIDVLNEDFGATGGGVGGTNTRIQFTLAGITRSNNTNWYNDTGTYYDSLAWDTTQYLNIYTNTASGNLGYAYVPSGGGVVGNNWDRVVIYWSTVGRPGPYGAPYHLGRTTTHEVGHYLGLYHTFQGGCASQANCANNGDLICDTNNESSPNFSPCTRTTCSTLDPTHNYMDYSDDVCMNQFTPNQANRMRCTLTNFRVDLAPIVLPGPAVAPSPAHLASNVGTSTTLAWTAGSDAVSHDIYFGTNPSPGAGEFKGNKSSTTFNPGALANSTTYYWRIDEVNTSGTTTGTVWSFTTEAAVPPDPATPITPAHLATDVARNQDLLWAAGFGATSHDVYFGTTDPPPFIGNQSEPSYDPGTMDRLQTYYWRIDEVNATGTTPGTVWSFTTWGKSRAK